MTIEVIRPTVEKKSVVRDLAISYSIAVNLKTQSLKVKVPFLSDSTENVMPSLDITG